MQRRHDGEIRTYYEWKAPYYAPNYRWAARINNPCRVVEPILGPLEYRTWNRRVVEYKFTQSLANGLRVTMTTRNLHAGTPQARKAVDMNPWTVALAIAESAAYGGGGARRTSARGSRRQRVGAAGRRSAGRDDHPPGQLQHAAGRRQRYPAGPSRPLHYHGRGIRLFFRTPPDAGSIRLGVPSRQRGRTWSFRADDPRALGHEYGCDDVVVALESPLTPLVASDPSALETVLRLAGG